jgi:hypothetical protein
MTRECLPICVVIALAAAGCGSNESAAQLVAPTPVPSALSAPSLTVDGRTSLSAIGETSQLRAVVTQSDGTSRDVTNDVRWNSRDPFVATVSASGLATAVGFGAARIDAAYDTLNSSFQIAVTPAGTFAATGEVREPGQGPIAGVRVLEPASGKSTLTDQLGTYTLAALAGRRLRFDKDGYESGELDIAPDTTGFMRMQRIVRITAGETATVPKLTHMDVWYDVGSERCAPCRLIRLIAPSGGTIRFELAWERDVGSPLHLWVGGRRYSADMNGTRVTADAAVGAGENVVYVGYYRWTTIYGSSVAFTLATTLSR